MGASDLIGRLALAGVRLARIGEDRIAAEPREALTEELRELIRSMVRVTGGGDGTGTGRTAAPQKTTDLQILEELKAIRELLETKV